MVAVGGTFLTVKGSDPTYAWVNETAWGNAVNSGYYGGGGGGISTEETQPAYQKGAVSAFSTTQRTYPDVSADADPNSGVDVYDSYDFGNKTAWATIGGTSLACPLWAGIIGVADQGRAVAGMGPLDGPTQTLPDLYNLYNSSSYNTDFHDVVSGDNGYSAGLGYDLASGIGTPTGSNLLPTLASGPMVATVATATPNPVDGTTTPLNGTNLSVQGIEGGSQAGLSYAWTATSIPNGAAAPTFSVNNSTTANDTTATFSAAGTYVFLASITDQEGLTAISSVTVIVNQTVTAIALAPNPVTLNVGTTQQFTIVASDQFNNPFVILPPYTATWATTIGTINKTGMLTAPNAPGSGTVTVSNVQFSGTPGTFTATAAVTVTATQISLFNAMVAPGPSGSTTAQMTVQLDGVSGIYVNPITVAFKTADGTAIGTNSASVSNPANYMSVNGGTVTFSPQTLLTLAQQRWTPQELTGDVGNQYEYAVWQGDVVWQGSSGQILFNDGTTTQQLSPLGSNSQNPAIDGSADPLHPYVIWSQAVGGVQQIFLCQIGGGPLGTNVTTQLTNDVYDDNSPKVFGKQATWSQNISGMHEILYDSDLTAATPSSVTSVISDYDTDNYLPQISGTSGLGSDTYVAWYGDSGSPGTVYQDVLPLRRQHRPDHGLGRRPGEPGTDAERVGPGRADRRRQRGLGRQRQRELPGLPLPDQQSDQDHAHRRRRGQR